LTFAPRCRFAPTTSGPAHPGTLLAALLCWLDARSRGAELLLRLEDIDPQRCTPERADDMRAALRWLGLDWDGESLQSRHRAAHEAALAELRRRGLVYACTCSRSRVRREGRPAADGGWRYPGTCRDAGHREGALRLRLSPGRVTPVDESGLDLSQDPYEEMGDPVLRRRDGAITYHLACVVDDAQQQVTRVVRGRDLAVCTALHVTLQRCLDLPTPTYRHHLLLLAREGGKLAKLHGAAGWHELRRHYTPERLCGLLAGWVGLRDRPEPASPAELLPDFCWSRVRPDDVALEWSGTVLERSST
jgi:glutamyl/glutaminyl-tRNA synthetase